MVNMSLEEDGVGRQTIAGSADSHGQYVSAAADSVKIQLGTARASASPHRLSVVILYYTALPFTTLCGVCDFQFEKSRQSTMSTVLRHQLSLLNLLTSTSENSKMRSTPVYGVTPA